MFQLSFNNKTWLYCLRVFTIFAILLIIFLQIYSVIIYHEEASVKLPSQFGNFKHVRDSLNEDQQKKDFSFAVVGDTRGTGTYERIAEKLRDEPLSFAVILGDFAHRGTEGHHAYFRAEVPEIVFPFPVFLVMGNHDVDDRNFPVSRFEEEYGPSNFSFVYRNCLFVILRIREEPHSNEETLKFTKNLLDLSSGQYKKTFIMGHFSPPVLDSIRTARFQGEDELVTLLDQHKVDYYIAGHQHGYTRGKVNETVYLVSGAGGNHLDKTKYDRFHHAVVLSVGDNSISERILAVGRSSELEDRLERLAMSNIYPLISNHWTYALIIDIALLCLTGLFIRKSLNPTSKTEIAPS